jgi:hypothetical protein
VTFYGKKLNPRRLKNNLIYGCSSYPNFKIILVLGHRSETRDWNLVKVVHLQAHTRPHVHQKVEIFGTSIASTMACQNFKNGETSGLGPLWVNYGNTEQTIEA